MKYIGVIVELTNKNTDKIFTYKTSSYKNIKIGERVIVPFGNRTLEGFVVSIDDNKPDYECRDIISVIDNEPVLNDELLELGKYMSKKTFSSLSSCYQTMLPKGLKAKKNFNINIKYDKYIVINKDSILEGKRKEIYDFIKKNGKVLKKDLNFSNYMIDDLIKKNILKIVYEEVNRLKEKDNYNYKIHDLNLEQKKAFDTIINSTGFKPFLLHGVTGSGKTEVYMHVIDEVLKENKEVILLVPEISLTSQLTNIFKSRYKGNVAILHSGLSDGEKFDEFRKIKNKTVNIVVGARSAIFAPFTNIGLIIIDEEQSSSYHQESSPTYSAIDIALKRGKYHNCKVILGSATPSIESYTRSKLNIYTLIELKNRVNNQEPKVYYVDMCNEYKRGNFIISDLLKTKIQNRLLKKEQIIILLNRRGYTTSLVCSNCSNVIKCPKCDIPLVYHKSINKLKCHYCSYEEILPKVCPKCNKKLNFHGIGTERLEETLKEMFDCSIIRMDNDTTSKKGSHEQIVESFRNNEYDILIGTQMIAKGLDFDNVTLVGVINGDASLNFPDFRSGERTFELLNQVAGRSGRSNKRGEVVIQGFNIDHYSIRFAGNNDYKGFYEMEMKIRKKLNYPPYCSLLLIKIMDKNIDNCFKEGDKIINYLKQDGITLLGPSSSLIPKINNIYCVQIIVKYKEYKQIYEKIKFINNQYKESKIKVILEINPLRL